MPTDPAVNLSEKTGRDHEDGHMLEVRVRRLSVRERKLLMVMTDVCKEGEEKSVNTQNPSANPSN